jgi:hypothetical protein
MTEDDATSTADSDTRYDQTNIIVLDDDTEEEIGAITGRSPPIPSVGDLVSLHNFQFEASETTVRAKKDETMSFRVVDRALHYATTNEEPNSGGLTTEVLLYVVSKEEWATRRQRGS